MSSVSLTYVTNRSFEGVARPHRKFCVLRQGIKSEFCLHLLEVGFHREILTHYILYLRKLRRF